MIDDALQCVMLSLSLPRLVQLKLVDRQWRRVARRVLTSDEWLYMGLPQREYNDRNAECEVFQQSWWIRIAYCNLRSMRYAVRCQWNVLQLPCRIGLSLRDGDDEIGILEDLTVDSNMCIRSINVTIGDSMRFFSPEHFLDEYLNGATSIDVSPFDSYEKMSDEILQSILPLVPDSKRHWVHPESITLGMHLTDKSRPVRRSTGEDVRV